MPLFYFRFEARPQPLSPDYGEHGGAAVNCWIKHGTQSEAESQARQMIEAKPWEILNCECAREMTRERQLPEGMGYFEQAELDGEVLVWHPWPPGSDAEDRE